MPGSGHNLRSNDVVWRLYVIGHLKRVDWIRAPNPALLDPQLAQSRPKGSCSAVLHRPDSRIDPAAEPCCPPRSDGRACCVCAPAVQALSGLSGSDIKESAFQPSEQPGHRRHRFPGTTRLAELAKAQHPRILATYGGEYSDPKLERMVAKVVGSLTTVSGNPEPDLPHHHPQFAQRQRFRAARRLSLRDARASGARQRFGRTRRGHRP